MSKNTQKNIVASKVDASNKVAELRAALEVAQNELIQVEEQTHLELLAKVNALPAQFELETMDQFLTMIKHVTKTSGAKRTVLTPENRIEVANMLIAGTSTKEIAIKFRVSIGTVNLIKKEAGLTKARAVAQPVVDTPVTQ